MHSYDNPFKNKKLVKKEWINHNTVIIDVGINRVEGNDGGKRLVGDAEFSSCSEIAGAITPVPGGVGPMTIACLLVNTLVACCRKHKLAEPDIIPN